MTSIFSGHKESGQALKKLIRLLTTTAEKAPREIASQQRAVTYCTLVWD